MIFPAESSQTYEFAEPDKEFPLVEPRFNIAQANQHRSLLMRMAVKSRTAPRGLIPWWAKDPSIKNRTINARRENLTEKASFKTCLSGAAACTRLRFLQSGKGKGKDDPMRFKLNSGEPFAFAGFWDPWRNQMESSHFPIVTTEPNDLLRPIHEGMPVMLNDDCAIKRLNATENSDALSLLTPSIRGDGRL
jgi:putative SOS response-associated peptidase YedK